MLVILRDEFHISTSSIHCFVLNMKTYHNVEMISNTVSDMINVIPQAMNGNSKLI